MRVNAYDKHRLAEGNAQALALTDGVIYDSLVSAEDVALKVNKVTLLGQRADSALYKRGIIVIGNKTDFLTVGLFCGDKPKPLGIGADGVFAGEVTQGHKRFRQLLLGKAVEGVRLVFCI